jgi:hypothetical protein
MMLACHFQPKRPGIRMRQALVFALASSVLVNIATSSVAVAQEAEPVRALRPFIGLGYTSGGNTLLRIFPKDSSDPTKEVNISAGAGLVLQLGLDYRLRGLPLSIQGSVGIHNDQDNSSTGERYSFRRYPIEAQLKWHANERWNVGFGARKATHAVLSIVNGTSGEQVLSINERARLKSNIGTFLEGEYAVTPAFSLKMRYVHENYKLTLDDGTTEKFDGNHVGLIGAYYFN